LNSNPTAASSRSRSAIARLILTGDDDYRHLDMHRSGTFEHLKPACLRHVQIQQQAVGLL